MINAAIVENSGKSARKLMEFLDRFSQSNEEVRYRWFEGTKQFLEEYHFQFDLIFMDIELEDGNGMETAAKLREKDPVVTLIFVTHLAQYAVQSYEVDALDYILKPVKYPAFELKMKRALRRLQKEKITDIIIGSKDQSFRISSASIKYVEIYKHHILYHTEDGDYETYGVLKNVEESLPAGEFFRMGSSFLVNLRYVGQMAGQSITIDGREIPISRLKKKEFLEALHNYYIRRG